MEYKRAPVKITPRLIIHGGAGNITPSSLPPPLYAAYTTALLRILSETHHYLLSPPDRTALDTATFAVMLLEDNPLFNSGRGAVFTRDGGNELEASLMVSRGKKKRGVGVMGLRSVRNPIRLAREMLLRGERDLDGGNGEHRGPMAEADGRGAQGHSQMCGEGAERLAREWGVETVEPAYFFTQQRWDEHVAGLEREKAGAGVATWDREKYVSQGTCGAVALDARGVVCVATSTGGMTNKLAGRIGDTPTLGAGFWAEEWEADALAAAAGPHAADGGAAAPVPILVLSDALRGLMADCLPGLRAYRYAPLSCAPGERGDTVSRATGISGTGNGDSFLRVNAARTVSAIARYKGDGRMSLREAMREITGPGGELEKSAGDRWEKTGEGEGGMIGIECTVVKGRDGEIKETKSHVVLDYNCSGMFRALVTEDGKAVCSVWRKNQYEGLAGYEQEGREYDLADLMKKW